MLNNKKRYLPLLLFIFSLLIVQVRASEYTLEELDELLKLKALTVEEYNILKMELQGESSNRQQYYSIKINSKRLSNTFKVVEEKKRKYLSLKDFFSILGFKNYEVNKSKEIVNIKLGTALEEIVLDVKNNKVYKAGEEILNPDGIKLFIVENEDLYIENDMFKKIFLTYLGIDEKDMEINAQLGFTPPKDINQMLEITSEKLERESEDNELIFKGRREFFNLGYAHFTWGTTYSKSELSKSFERTWDGNIDYQGGLFYGEFTTSYDLKTKEFGSAQLTYEDIWKSHVLDITRSSFEKDGLWSLSFYKNKSYYEEGNEVVIREKVPIGSRVELLYLGVPIEIQSEQNGEVIFRNSQIKTDKEYQLKIYYPDGMIILKDIRTTRDYNRQAKNEIEYNINIAEARVANAQGEEEKSYDSDIGIYYGITDNLTLGGGYSRTFANEEEYRYDRRARGELVYGDTLNGYSYTFTLNGEKSLEKAIGESQYGYIAEITKDKLRATYTGNHYKFDSLDKQEKAGETKQDGSLELSYDWNKYVDLNYTYEFDKTFDGLKNDYERLGIDVNYTLGGILLSGSLDIDMKDSQNNQYSVEVYYGGFKSMTVRFENRWINAGEDYEMSLSLYNNNFGGLVDFSTELTYSSEKKEYASLSMSLLLDDWFDFDFNGDKTGHREFRVGIDKFIDLKNPTHKIRDMNISRANIVTFVDSNNNNIYDKGEKTVGNVDVEIGNQKVTTDENGRATIFSLPNGVMYNVTPTIKKPSYTLGNNKLKVVSKFSGDIDVHIPIKPMKTLSGVVKLDESLGIAPEKVDEFYSNIIIQVLDEEGKEIDMASPDNTGYFDISGLFPEVYTLKIFYIGDDYKIMNYDEKLNMVENRNNKDDDGVLQVLFNITNNKIQLLSKL